MSSTQWIFSYIFFPQKFRYLLSDSRPIKRKNETDKTPTKIKPQAHRENIMTILTKRLTFERCVKIDREKELVWVIAYVNHAVFSLRISLMRHVQCPNSYSAAPNCWRSLAYSWKIHTQSINLFITSCFVYKCIEQFKFQQMKIMKTEWKRGKCAKKLKLSFICAWLLLLSASKLK